MLAHGSMCFRISSQMMARRLNVAQRHNLLSRSHDYVSALPLNGDAQRSIGLLQFSKPIGLTADIFWQLATARQLI